MTANQEEISDHETFQLEYDTSTGRWYIRTMGDRYWTLETAGGIQASSAKKYENEMPRIPRLISFSETVIYDLFFFKDFECLVPNGMASGWFRRIPCQQRKVYCHQEVGSLVRQLGST